jgi:hypothetical protein
MNKTLFVKLMICILTFSFGLYSYMDKKNELTSLKIQLPKLSLEISTLKQQVKKLQYEIDQFEDPTNLMNLAQRPEFSHLKQPILEEILTVQEGLAYKEP